MRVLSRPGLWLQRLTTREPDLAQLEVAIASLRAVMTAEQTAEVDAPRRATRPGRRARGLTPDRPHFYTPGHDDLAAHVHRARAARRTTTSPSRSSRAACGATAASTPTARTSRRARATALPAIAAWQQSHREQFGTEILDAPIELWPEVYPNVAQSKYLLREGVREPTISSLTRIGTVEGFGALIRNVRVDDLQSHFDESIAGTAIAHLQQRPVRGARARRSRLGGRGRPQADVVRGARHRVRASRSPTT